MSAARVAAMVIVCSVLSGALGYALAPRAPERAEPAVVVDEGPSELEPEPAALEACEVRLVAAEEALAQRPAAVEHPAIDPASLPEASRAALASPEVSVAIEAEVERRITARFEAERERRRAEWDARRAETRERLRAIGIDEPALEQVTPALCAIRDVYRSAWSAGRGAGGDAGVRGGRRALREATRELREEVETSLGPERMARLEEEGGMRALGGAVECGDEGGPGRPR